MGIFMRFSVGRWPTSGRRIAPANIFDSSERFGKVDAVGGSVYGAAVDPCMLQHVAERNTKYEV